MSVSVVAFGAGPVSGLMVGSDPEMQRRTVQRAIDAQINWFDTAPTYGEGRSESALGEALRACCAPGDLHIASKVRLMPEDMSDIPAAVRRSLDASVARLGVERLSLLQLHNSVTSHRGDLPTSICVHDVFGKQGVLAVFQSLRDEGLVHAFGFTGMGDRRSIRELVTCGAFTAAQVPLNLLTPFSAEDRSAGSIDFDYESLVAECSAHGVGVMAIRVFAGGALVGQAPSAHTRSTKFFTLDLFQRDQRRAAAIAAALPAGMTLAEASVRFVLGIPAVTTALIGLATPREVDQTAAYAARGPLEPDVWDRVCRTGRSLAG